jgi:hypothetical protein
MPPTRFQSSDALRIDERSFGNGGFGGGANVLTDETAEQLLRTGDRLCVFFVFLKIQVNSI